MVFEMFELNGKCPGYHPQSEKSPVRWDGVQYLITLPLQTRGQKIPSQIPAGDTSPAELEKKINVPTECHGLSPVQP